MAIDQKTLKKIFVYNKETGIFYKRQRKEVGKKVGNVSTMGYLRIGIQGNSYLAHRLAWLYVYGEFPKGYIDHINHNKLDNRIENLRCVSPRDNQKNILRQKKNATGIVGVAYTSPTSHLNRRFRVYINVNGNQKHLGYTDTLCEAKKLREAGKRLYGYHENHS